MGAILVITGPSGAGKTTVSRLVAESLDPSVHLQSDDFMSFIVSGWTDPSLPEAAAQNYALGGAVAGAAIGFATGGYTVVLDGHLFPEGLAGLVSMCEPQGVDVHYAVLRPDLATCLDRAVRRVSDPRHRPETPFDLESFTRLHDRFANLGDHEDNVIDASTDADAAATGVLVAFAAGTLQT